MDNREDRHKRRVQAYKAILEIIHQDCMDSDLRDIVAQRLGWAERHAWQDVSQLDIPNGLPVGHAIEPVQDTERKTDGDGGQSGV